MKNLLSLPLLCLCLSFCCKAQTSPVHYYNTPAAGNPIIPGYFADPTVKKIGDTYYIYATTDGNGGGLGPSQVWVSKDFADWTIMPMNWPSTYHIWAPDVMEGKDGKYYMYYCEPCKIYCGVSETPRGPWTNILGADTTVLVPDRFVTNSITLDGQHFIDDDGSVYLYWGTWGIYKGFGCGAGKLSDDLKSFTETRLIPNTEATDFFEAPFVIKKDGIYYFTYSSGSCHDHTYRVQYATSKEGPLGPYVFADNNPILETSADSTIHGPGHHSILQEGDDYYIVYHRHNIPGSTRGMHRQIAVDKLVFTPDGRIEKVDAGHEGIGALQTKTNPFPNLAFGKKVTASSYYNDWFKPSYATDDNNATLWRPRTCGSEWIEIDLEKPRHIERVWTQFEYATSYYQYLLETSLDGKTWQIFSDRRNNTLAGSPMVDYGNATARYLRLTFTGSEKNGLSAALWNIKVFGGSKTDPPQQLVHLYPESYSAAKQCWENSNGMLSRSLKLQKGEVRKETVAGREALVMQPGTRLVSDFDLPASLFSEGNYTLTYQQYKEGAWQTVVLPSNDKNTLVSLDKKQGLTISAGKQQASISNLRLYNWKQEPAEIRHDASSATIIAPPAPMSKQGLITSISANDYEEGKPVNAIRNAKGLPGSYLPVDTLINVEMKNGRKAFRFDGTQTYRSDFPLPPTMKDNAPYTMAAWILNPEANEFECAADLTSSHGELEKIMLGYGTSERSGLICHYGWYEDMGLPDFKGSDRWLHVAVTYDGHVERLYLDGKLVKEKDIVLRLQNSSHITLGRNAEDEWRFSGWLHSLEVYDTPFSEEEIHNLL